MASKDKNRYLNKNFFFEWNDFNHWKDFEDFWSFKFNVYKLSGLYLIENELIKALLVPVLPNPYTAPLAAGYREIIK